MARHRAPWPEGVQEPRYAWEFARLHDARLQQKRHAEGSGERAAGPVAARRVGVGRPAVVDDAGVGELGAASRREIAAAVRAGRAEHGLSQRELAERAGLSQSAVAKLEAEVGNPSLATVVRVLAACGGRLSLERPAQPTRMSGEYVRDGQGRRLPAHLSPYRLSAPPSWWSGATDIRRWSDEPKWSFYRGWRTRPG